MLYLLSSLSGIPELIGLIILFILILWLSVVVTRWISKSGLNLQKTKNIKVVEVYRLNQNKCIYIVKMGNRYSALGITKDHIEYLTDLDEDELVFGEEGTNNQIDFITILKKSKERYQAAKNPSSQLSQEEQDDEKKW